MIKFLIPMLLIANTAFAGLVVCYNGDGSVSDYGSGNPVAGCLFYDPPNSHTQAEYDAAILLFQSVQSKYIKVVNGDVVEMSQAEKDVVDSAENVARDFQVRDSAKSNLIGFSESALFQRAYADIIKDEINILRAWLLDFKADVAAATNLADLKTRVAANESLNARTLSQLRTAIQNRIDSGEVDS